MEYRWKRPDDGFLKRIPVGEVKLVDPEVLDKCMSGIRKRIRNSTSKRERKDLRGIHEELAWLHEQL